MQKDSTSGPRVAIATGPDRRENIRQAQLLLGEAYLYLLKTAKSIFVHPNLVTDRRREANTHVDAVRAVLDVIALHRGDAILVGDASYHNTKKAWERFDFPSLSRSGNIRFLDLNDDETVDAFAYDRDFVRQRVPFSKTVLHADGSIVVVPAKMHSYYTVSLALKTHIVGSMVVRSSPFGIHARWPHIHTGYAQAHKTLADVYHEHPAHGAIIDGVGAMEGNGPASGEIVNLRWAVASLDPVAADAVACWLMGFEIGEIGYLTYLARAGYTVDPEAMEIVGEPNWRELRRNLVRPDTFPDILGWQHEKV